MIAERLQPWSLGKQLRVIVSAEHVDELARKLSSDDWLYFQNILSANGINMYFKGEHDWDADPTTGTAYVHLSFERDNDPELCHVFIGNITRQIGREIAAGLTGASDTLVPVVLNYFHDWYMQVLGQVPVYFEAAENYQPPTEIHTASAPKPSTSHKGPPVARRTVPRRAARKSGRSM